MWGKKIGWSIENPLKTWWKARKYFRRPNIEFHWFSHVMGNCPYASLNAVSPIIDVLSRDVMWKWKWNSVRHERDPYIWVCFFKRFGFSINFKIYYNDEYGELRDGGMYYWEYLLDYLYNRHDLTKYDIWGSLKEGYEAYTVDTPLLSLNKKGLKEIGRYEEVYGNI